MISKSRIRLFIEVVSSCTKKSTTFNYLKASFIISVLLCLFGVPIKNKLERKSACIGIELCVAGFG